MKTKSIFIIFIIILILSLVPIASASDISHTRRHIAMVYDDSTSMYVSDSTNQPVLNWAYANYMTQAFSALLNPQDSLYITYMSDAENPVPLENLMLMDKNEAIETIRQHNSYINKTPFEAVESAYASLLELDESLTDEYWLVILTDGDFTNFKEDITGKLYGYIDEMAQVGKTLKVVFFAIGDAAIPPVADDERGLFVYTTGTHEIVSTMAAVANNISGRHSISSGKMNLLASNKLSIDMMLPIRSLTIFYQKDENTLTSIENNNKDEMAISSQYRIKAPDEFLYDGHTTAITDPDAFGMITSISSQQDGGILSDGRYVLNFENTVDLDNIRVMYEPAIDITIVYKSNGIKVESPKNGDIVDIEVILINAKSGKALTNDALPVPVECSIQISSKGEEIASSNGFIVENVTLDSGNTSINTEITMPGYFTLRNRQDYIAEIVEATPEPTATPYYDESLGSWPPEVRFVMMPPYNQNIKLDALEETEPFLFVPLFNDQKGELSDLQLGTLEIICPRTIVFEYSINESEAGYNIYPKYSGDLLTTSTGIITANIIFTSEYNKVASTTLTFVIQDLSWLERNYRNFAVISVALIFTLLILGILVLRRKFPKDSWLEYVQERKMQDGTWSPIKMPARASLHNLHGKWRMVPFRAERLSISGLVFKATSSDQVIRIPKKYVSTNIATTRGPLSRKSDFNSDLDLKNGVKIFLEQGYTRIAFVYHGPKRTLLTGKKEKSSEKKGDKRKLFR